MSDYDDMPDEIRTAMRAAMHRHEAQIQVAAAVYDDAIRKAGRDAETSIISTKHFAYVVPRSAAQTWEQHYPEAKDGPPAGYEDHKFWPTPQGWIFARPDDETQEHAPSR